MTRKQQHEAEPAIDAAADSAAETPAETPARKPKATPDNTPLPGGGSWAWDRATTGWVRADAPAEGA